MEPLAERLRPKRLDDYIGQEHLVGPNSVLRNVIKSGNIPSIILWGPPGTGKTTLANIISEELDRPFFTLSAISSGVKDVRDVIDKAQKPGLFNTSPPILFIDEIHRFSKAQQDSLLGAVEKGTVTLIGATTENPSFEVISALLSRSQVYILKPLEKENLIQLLERAKAEEEKVKLKKITITEHEAMLRLSGGDARKLLNIFELVINSVIPKQVNITNELVTSLVQEKIALYDKSGEQHYDIISAFIKSIRGSDPNGALYWLARMIEGGEDPLFIARRILISASEDIGNANPTALVIANNCFQAVNVIGYPECSIILSQAVVYLACSPKSNASYMGIKKAKAIVAETGNLSVPMHLRNAPTKLMNDLGYGENYQYSHDFEQNFKAQEYLPEEISSTQIYDPGHNAKEDEFRKRLKTFWQEKYGY